MITLEEITAGTLDRLDALGRTEDADPWVVEVEDFVFGPGSAEVLRTGDGQVLLDDGRYAIDMSANPVRVELSDEASEAVRREAARAGQSEADIVELAVRRLASPSVLDRLWSRAELSEEEAMTLAIEEVSAVRSARQAG